MSKPDRRMFYGVSLAAVAVLASACGGSSGGTATVTPQGPAALASHSGPLGNYLTDSKGMTLYIFSADTGATSTCNSACAKEWPPLTTAGAATAAGGAKPSMLGSSKRADGTTQVTYAGHPVYYFNGDSASGDMNGEGSTDFNGNWTIVSPAGAAVIDSGSTPAPYGNGGSTPSSSSSHSSSWG